MNKSVAQVKVQKQIDSTMELLGKNYQEETLEARKATARAAAVVAHEARVQAAEIETRLVHYTDEGMIAATNQLLRSVVTLAGLADRLFDEAFAG